MSKSFRVILFILIICLILSFAYAAIESVHDCHGDRDCPICKVLAVLSLLFGAVVLPALFCAVLGREQESQAIAERAHADSATLVAMKVKLSD